MLRGSVGVNEVAPERGWRRRGQVCVSALRHGWLLFIVWTLRSLYELTLL